MDWVKLLTEFDGNPKVLSVGLCGAGLYARALAYCGKYETDGVIPEAWVEQAVAREGFHDLPDQLVAAGLWKRGGNRYEIEDFTDVNRSKKQMDSLRESRSVAGKSGGEAKTKQSESKSHSYSNSSSPSSSKSVSSFDLEFENWLFDYRKVTGRSTVRGSKPARRDFATRRKEGWTLEELKQATVGCHGDDFCRENGHDVPETILRSSKVERYIQLASKPKSTGSKGMDNARRLAGIAAEMRAAEGAEV